MKLDRSEPRNTMTSAISPGSPTPRPSTERWFRAPVTPVSQVRHEHALLSSIHARS